MNIIKELLVRMQQNNIQTLEIKDVSFSTTNMREQIKRDVVLHSEDLESVLKDIAINLDVKVSFRLNDQNEKRMPDELLSELKSRIGKSGGQDIKAKVPIIDRVGYSTILGNLLSHDNPFNPKIGDLRAFWADIIELEKIFYCQEVGCKRPKVTLRNYDNVAKKIRCGCDTTKYEWKP